MKGKTTLQNIHITLVNTRSSYVSISHAEGGEQGCPSLEGDGDSILSLDLSSSTMFSSSTCCYLLACFNITLFLSSHLFFLEILPLFIIFSFQFLSSNGFLTFRNPCTFAFHCISILSFNSILKIFSSLCRQLHLFFLHFGNLCFLCRISFLFFLLDSHWSRHHPRLHFNV